MSRIGRMPVEIPAGVEVKIDGNNVTVKGPKGTLTKSFPAEISIKQENGVINVTRPNDEKKNRALHGLTRALLQNMVVGVTAGYEKKLEFVGVGYRAAKSGKTLTLSLGYSHPVIMEDPEGITTEVPDQTHVIVRGIDKELVGQHAANIRIKRAPEPYHGKGVKYENEVIRRKVGKTGK
ncbi:MAG: 50S ribosomal protein L6 [Lachnospiraceae bacterium]|nr:50S ribosomal protein L6 [Lachnospiraceae bacterium]